MAEGADDSVAAPVGWAEVDEEDLVGGVMDDLAEFVPQFGEVDGCELALENRELQVVAEIAARLKDFSQAFVVGDVVTNEIRIPHGRASRWGLATRHPCVNDSFYGATRSVVRANPEARRILRASPTARG